ncbi:hypothetical protein HDU96_007046 [Phlyctochytrium bullatum]|nr:hypothetical protein HDU96_007046 [Phlyctochytrium bullatum]
MQRDAYGGQRDSGGATTEGRCVTERNQEYLTVNATGTMESVYNAKNILAGAVPDMPSHGKPTPPSPPQSPSAVPQPCNDRIDKAEGGDPPLASTRKLSCASSFLGASSVVSTEDGVSDVDLVDVAASSQRNVPTAGIARTPSTTHTQRITSSNSVENSDVKEFHTVNLHAYETVENNGWETLKLCALQGQPRESPIVTSDPGFDLDDSTSSDPPPLDPVTFRYLYTAIIFLVLLPTLSATVVATALKSIVKDLGRPEFLPWIGSAYMVSCTVAAMACGRVADAKYQGILNGTSGAAAVLGPLIGGLLTDRLSWRYCFWLNLPIGLVALLILVLKLHFPNDAELSRHPLPFHIRLMGVDWVGIGLMAVCTACLATALQLGGTEWAWKDPRTVGMFVASGIIGMGLAAWEVYMKEKALVPAGLFKRGPTVLALIGITVILGYEYFGVSYYLPLFFQVCYDMSATMAGVHIIPLVVGFVLMSIGAGLFVSRTDNWLVLLYVGPVLSGSGIAILSTLTQDSPRAVALFLLFIIGLGLGSVLAIRVVAIQSVVPKKFLAVATSLSQAGYLLGGMIGIAVTGAVYNNELARRVSNSAGLFEFISLLQNETDGKEVNLLQLRQKLPLDADGQLLLRELVEAFLGAFSISFFVMVGFVGVMLVLAFCASPSMKKYGHRR